MYIHTHIHLYMCVRIYIYNYAHTHNCLFVYMSIHIHMHASTLTTLHMNRFAAGYGHLNVVKWLIKRGVGIDFRGVGGTALIKASRFGHGI